MGLGFLLMGCAAPPVSETLMPGQNVLSPEAIHAALTQTVNFDKHVKPIFQAKCVACHAAEAQPQGVKLTSHSAAVKSGALGALIVPGHPERSILLTKVKGAHAHVKAMPPVGERLTTEETAILERWIQQGAHWPVAQ